MPADWRRKTYYPPRVLLDTERLLNSPFPDTLVCLTGAQVEMLRNLCQYLHRRSTFAQDYTTAGYLAPDNDDWQTIQAMVADLEAVLMSTMCEDLIALLEAQNTTLDLMKTCICAMAQNSLLAQGRLPDLAGYADDNLVNYEDETQSRGDPTTPGTDTAKCELAQSMYYYFFDMMTEQLLPFANNTADSITAILIGSSWFVGLSTQIGIPIAILSNIVLVTVAWAIDGSIANYENWLWSSRDEIVCVLYNAYPDYDAASVAIKSWVDAQESISYLDKQLTKSVLASAWHMTWVSKDQQVNGTWDSRFVPGQCADCNMPAAGCLSVTPCDAGDWTGGITCTSGYPRVTGGNGYYTRASLTIPAEGGDVSLRWIPRGSSGTTARISWGLVRVSDSQLFSFGETAERVFDTPVTELETADVQLNGVACYLWVKQEGNEGDIIYWCVD